MVQHLAEQGHQRIVFVGPELALGLPEPPRRISPGNDRSGIASEPGITCRNQGLRIPEEMALAGFDDKPITEHIASGVTTIHQSFRQMGQPTAEKLLALVDGKPKETYGSVLPLELVVRASLFMHCNEDAWRQR